jgi:2,5-dihydroxypyridine 5,6-dioxygenase
MGLPWWEPGGGENHPDGIVFDQSLWIDGELISERGRFSGPPHLRLLHDAMKRRLD